MRETIIGDLEPAHVIEKANDLRALRMLQQGGEHPWLSTAQKFHGDGNYYDPTPEYLAWQKVESKKLYKSADSNGDIFLVQNPEAANWTKDAKGKFSRIRPAAIPTGETIQKKKVAGPKWSY